MIVIIMILNFLYHNLCVHISIYNCLKMKFYNKIIKLNINDVIKTDDFF